MAGVKRERSLSLDNKASGAGVNKAKKLKLLASHSLESPFPDFARPTKAEAQDVYDILASAHPKDVAKDAAHSSKNAASTCGSVPNVLESLIGTILSQNTSGKNSTAAMLSLEARFGKNNFEAIATAQYAEVVEAIRSGGLANKKAAVIQRILKDVKEKHGSYSLQHLAGEVKAGGNGEETPHIFTDDEAMAELVSYNGVGPKTASCVLLFCLGRASFPVDTHVFRISRMLGWVPEKADRVTAQAHLDLKIPDELKYGLHVAMVEHGRRCTGCKKKGADCPLKNWLRTRKHVGDAAVEEKAVKAEEEAEATAPGVTGTEAA